MKDMVGKEVKVGDFVAYALAVHRTAIMCIYEVLETSVNGWATVRFVKCKGDSKVASGIIALGLFNERAVVLEGYKDN